MPSLPFTLGVLDQSPVAEGSTPARALHNSIDLATLAESLGYTRYWVAEHHGSPTIAGSTPEVLIGAIASATSHIRVGSGGVMLPHYSPFKVAEAFSMLAGLHGPRIDLGLGRAAGTDPTTTFALQRDRRTAPPDDFPSHLAELLAYLSDTMPAGHPFARLARTLPGLPERPEPWLLGSSPQSGIWAAELGLPYAFADFISPHGEQIVARYREEFVGSIWSEKPRVVAAVWVVCGETDEEADRLSASSEMTFTLLTRGELIPVPTVERALRWREEERRRPPNALPVVSRQRRRIVGSPATVRAGLEAVAREYAADEVMIVTITHDHDARRRSYELIARECGLRPVAG